MKIKVYQHEIKDNLVGSLTNNVVSFSLFADVRPNLALADILPPTQFLDLFYFEDILVSSGWNGNDDIFGVGELWKAKSTPLLKKIDYMHDETDIIGVMCKVRAKSFDGTDISFESTADMLPKDLDLHVGGYLYKMWKDEKLQARMDDILANINDWCVSMECTFPNFDYGVITPNNEHFIIPRNDQTSFLTKHLRIYGGSGQYEGYKIGRYLRDFIFTGKGLVKNPANKRSVITNTEFLGAAASLSIFPSTEKKMEYTKEDVEKLIKQVADLEASVAALTTSLETEKAGTSKLTATLAGLTEANEAFKVKVTKLESELTTASASLTKANDELAIFAQEKVKASRLELFNDVDVDSAKAQELVNKFISLSDELFNDIVASMPKKKKEEKKEETKAVEVLETVVPETTIASVPVPQDKTKQTRESASAWLKSNMNSNKEKK